MAVFFILLFAAGRYRFALAALLWLGLLHGAAYLSAGLLSDVSARYVWLFTAIFRKIFFIASAGVFLISTITVGDCIQSFEKMRVPWGIVVPLAICFRFIPTLGYESRIIRDAMKVRGLYSARRFFTKPLASLELFLVTLLFRVMTIGEELAYSVSTRAVSGKRRKVWYREKSLSRYDLGFALAVLGTILCILFTPWRDFVLNTAI